MDAQQFRNPDAQYRIQPFWFWNGDMNEAELIRQIQEMHDKGVGGFFICPRQGLKVPYLSEGWFRLVKLAVQAAKERGMHVWLYDEYPYPSGMAGGEVTLLHPDAKHQTMAVTEMRVHGGDKLEKELHWAKIIYARAVPLSESGERMWGDAVDLREQIGNLQADPVFQKTGLTAYNQKRFFTFRTVYQLEWEAPSAFEQWDVLVYQEKEVEDFKYYGTFVDPCHKEAMATFIRLTHDRYAKYIGEEFGKTVKGMFTDEIGLLGRLPWSPRLPAYFEERNGYSIIEHLPALSDSSYPDAARIRYDYYQSAHELLTESYHKQVYDWCEQHGLQYVAEVPSIRMTTQRYSHIPGGDSCHEKLGRSLEWIIRRYGASFRDNPKMLSSIARQLGRERNMDECFHSVGWSMNLQDAKWMIDRMAAMGTNLYTFHAFFYTTDGMTQHDAPPSHFYQNPYWEQFRLLGDYTGRISYMMTEGTADIRIAVLDPTTSYWTHMANPLHHFDYTGTESKEKARLEGLKEEWRSLSVRLLQSRRDYDHLDAELLAEAAVENGRLVLGKASYSTLLLPPMTNLEGKAWETIKRFLADGGKVIAMGELPQEQIEKGSNVSVEMAEWFAGRGPQNEEREVINGSRDAHFVPRDAEAGIQAMLDQLESLLDRLEPRPVELVGRVSSEEIRSFLLQSRYMSDDEYVVFASNQEAGEWSTRLRFEPARIWHEVKDGDGGLTSLLVERLDLETGGIVAVKAAVDGDGLSVEADFAPYASRMYRMTRLKEDLRAIPIGHSVTEWNIEAEGPWSVRALQPNALRLEHFRLSIAGEEAGIVAAKTFVDQCADLAEHHKMPVAFSQVFGTPKKLRLQYPMDCLYTAEFVVEQLPETASILMDESAVLGEWELLVNGESYRRDQFVSHNVYDYSNIVCDITSALKFGSNVLEIRIQVAHDWEGVTDAIFVRGDFGVRLEGDGVPVLIVSPTQTRSLAVRDYVPGYPYFAGVLEYSRTLHMAETELAGIGARMLRFPDWDVHDTVEVLLNGEKLGVRPWTPYAWEVPAGLIRNGDNKLTVRVTTTLIGLLEGKYFDYVEHRVVPVT
jgi:hypothetical protein